MKVYDVLTPHNYSQKTCVVAESIASAEKAFLRKYPYTTILKIELHAEYVIVDRPADAGEGER